MLQALGALQCSHNPSKRASLLFSCCFPSSESCDTDGNKKVNLDEWISCLVDGSGTWEEDSTSAANPQNVLFAEESNK